MMPKFCTGDEIFIALFLFTFHLAYTELSPAVSSSRVVENGFMMTSAVLTKKMCSTEGQTILEANQEHENHIIQRSSNRTMKKRKARALKMKKDRGQIDGTKMHNRTKR